MAKVADLKIDSWANQSHYTLGTGSTVDGDHLVIPATSAYPNAWPVTTWDLTDSQFVVELVSPPNADNGSVSANIGVYLSTGNDAYFGWENNLFRAAVTVGGTATYHGYMAWSAASHRYFRIRETAGTLYMEAGPDPETFPTLVHSTPTPFAVTAIRPYIGAGNYQSAANPGSATWGTVNATVEAPAPTGPRNGGAAFMKQADGTWRPCMLRLLPYTAIIPQGYTTATVDVPARVRSYSEISHAYNGGTRTVPRPVGVQAGDLLVLYALMDSGTLSNLTAPSGFTQLGRVGGTGVRHLVAYKVATASEPANYTYAGFPTAADGSSMMVAVQDWSGSTANLAFAISPTSNANLNSPSVTPKTARNLLLASVSTDDNSAVRTWGWIPPQGMGAVGYTHNISTDDMAWSSGAVAAEEYNSTTATGVRTWKVNTASTQTVRINSTLAIPSGTRTATATQFLAEYYATGGTGGDKTDATDLPFQDSAGLSSTYHLFADGLDWSKNVGLMVYTDGSGEWGLDSSRTANTYLLGGTNGLIAVAKRQNMVLLTPRAPGGPCDDGDGVCWYDHSSTTATSPWQKLEWSNELIRYVLTRYNIDRRRIAIGGYSSGAQWTTAWWGPKYASQVMADGVAVAISYGGQPRVTPAITPEFKAAVPFVWDVGSLDTSYTQPTWDDGVVTGRTWYQDAGFTTTDLVVVDGRNHARDGEFGAIMEREITARVPPA